MFVCDVGRALAVFAAVDGRVAVVEVVVEEDWIGMRLALTASERFLSTGVDMEAVPLRIWCRMDLLRSLESMFERCIGGESVRWRFRCGMAERGSLGCEVGFETKDAAVLSSSTSFSFLYGILGMAEGDAEILVVVVGCGSLDSESRWAAES